MRLSGATHRPGNQAAILAERPSFRPIAIQTMNRDFPALEVPEPRMAYLPGSVPAGASPCTSLYHPAEGHLPDAHYRSRDHDSGNDIGENYDQYRYED